MNIQNNKSNARPANYWLKFSDAEITAIFDALESRKRLFKLYEGKHKDLTQDGPGSIWAEKRKAVEELQDYMLNQIPYSMNLIVLFPNGKQFVAPLATIGHMRLRWLRENNSSPEEMHMKSSDIVSWAGKHLYWSQLKKHLLSPPADPSNPYYRTMWSSGKVTLTYR